MTNQQLAEQLRKEANRLAERGENLYRIRAYRRAVMRLLQCRHAVCELLKCDEDLGIQLLQDVGIGSSLARKLAHACTTGEWPREPEHVMTDDSTATKNHGRPRRIARLPTSQSLSA